MSTTVDNIKISIEDKRLIANEFLKAMDNNNIPLVELFYEQTKSWIKEVLNDPQFNGEPPVEGRLYEALDKYHKRNGEKQWILSLNDPIFRAIATGNPLMVKLILDQGFSPFIISPYDLSYCLLDGEFSLFKGEQKNSQTGSNGNFSTLERKWL